MTEIGAKVETSLKSTYGEKWREALLVHILIGLGRSIMELSRTPSARGGKQLVRHKCADEIGGEAIKVLHENPLGYVRQVDEKLADELETQLHRIQKGPVKDDPERVFPELGEFIEAMGIHALMKLEGNNDDNEDISDIIQTVLQVSWEEASPTVREDTLRIIRLLAFFSSNM